MINKQKARILVVSNSLIYGGGETFIVNTLRPLSTFYEMFFLVYNNKLYEQLPNAILMKSVNLIKQLSEITNVTQDFQPDLIIYNGGSTLFLSIFVRFPKLLLRHTTNEYVRGFMKPIFYNWVLHIAYAKADKIVHVSNYSAEQQRMFNYKKETIYNGTNLATPKKIFYDGKRPLRLLFCARIDPSKGIETIINAMREIEPTVARLDVLGNGPLDTKLREMATSNVHFHGFIYDVKLFYEQADVYIQLSDFENCPFALIDAMNYSLPIISTRVGGIKEMLFHGTNGFVIEDKKPDIVASYIRLLAKYPELVRQYGEQGRNICEKYFDLMHTTQKYRGAIDRILIGKRIRP